jgi:hypothetical protein
LLVSIQDLLNLWFFSAANEKRENLLSAFSCGHQKLPHATEAAASRPSAAGGCGVCCRRHAVPAP